MKIRPSAGASWPGGRGSRPGEPPEAQHWKPGDEGLREGGTDPENGTFCIVLGASLSTCKMGLTPPTSYT